MRSLNVLYMSDDESTLCYFDIRIKVFLLVGL